MELLKRAVHGAFKDLSANGTKCALIGGLAIGVRAEPRTTRDADLAVAVTGDADADVVVFAMRKLGYRPDGVFMGTGTNRIALVRLVGKIDQSPRLDLAFDMSGIEREVVEAAKEAELDPGMTLPVAERGHLIALKLLSYDDVNRPQDRVDIMALLKRATPADMKLARGAVKLITERGYDRGRDLAKDLERFLEIVKRLRTDHPRP